MCKRNGRSVDRGDLTGLVSWTLIKSQVEFNYGQMDFNQQSRWFWLSMLLKAGCTVGIFFKRFYSYCMTERIDHQLYGLNYNHLDSSVAGCIRIVHCWMCEFLEGFSDNNNLGELLLYHKCC